MKASPRLLDTLAEEVVRLIEDRYTTNKRERVSLRKDAGSLLARILGSYRPETDDFDGTLRPKERFFWDNRTPDVDRIRDLLLSQGKNQAWLARELGCSGSALAKSLNRCLPAKPGEPWRPVGQWRFERFDEVARALGVTIDELVKTD